MIVSGRCSKTNCLTNRGKKAAIEEVDHVLKLLRLEAGSAILDLCCGPGRHSVELAR